MLQITGWAGFFRGVHQLRRENWVRPRLLLFWISTALLGCSTFCFAAAPLLNWGQIAWLMLTGAVGAVVTSALWGAFAAGPRIGPLRAAETANAGTGGIKIRTTPRTTPIGMGRGAWSSATVRNIEAMEVPL